MTLNHSVQFFDEQFQRQLTAGGLIFNPFEEMALRHSSGRVLDFGCGLGNLAVAAARRGCSVLTLDGSSAAISHLQRRARLESLAIEAIQSDLRSYEISEDFDARRLHRPFDVFRLSIRVPKHYQPESARA